MDRVVTRASFVHAIFYENADYRGNSWIIQNSHHCLDGDEGWQTLRFKKGDYWNDRISSLRVYDNCPVGLWEDWGCTGALLDVHASTSYVGRAMNDQASCAVIE